MCLFLCLTIRNNGILVVLPIIYNASYKGNRLWLTLSVCLLVT